MAEWRDPCPWRIVEDMGGAFALGLVGGSLFTTGKGLYAGGKGNKWKSAWTNTRLRAGRYGTNFAAWGFCFSVSECTMLHLRGVEDPINTITAGAASGAALAVRQGRGAMIVSGIFGGIILGVMEGVMLMVNKYQLDSQLQMQEEQQKRMEEYMKKQAELGEIGKDWGGKTRESKDDGKISAL